MVVRRCPQCHATTDDHYGFCIRCGYEFPKIEKDENTCPYCGFENPDEATFCVKCGTPLIFKNQFDAKTGTINPIVIKKEVIKDAQNYMSNRTSPIIIIFGYIFSILGGLLGLIIAIYLVTRKDQVAKRHGYIQLAILAFYAILIAVMFATGAIPPEVITNYTQLISGNITSLNTSL